MQKLLENEFEKGKSEIMATKTKIQWCDSTVNPIMGCGGCELYPSASEILARLDRMLSSFGEWRSGCSRQIYSELITRAYKAISNPAPGHSAAITTTNLWHLRTDFLAEVSFRLGKSALPAAEMAIGGVISCYAARLHLNKARSIVNPNRGFNPGYAPAFEVVRQFPGRVWEAARSRDLCGQLRPEKPWLDGLPRLIFVSDMGDAFSRESDFDFLEKEVIEPIRSPQGSKHIWLWLTKRPARMARFGKIIGGFPPNVVAMTTLTGPDKLRRVDDLLEIPAGKRGLSVEPLRERILPRDLNLHGIDWVIIGGESGRSDCVHAFDLAWARELRDHCKAVNAPFFLKQLGCRPVENGKALRLRDGHGGDWSEWPEDLRVRQMPASGKYPEFGRK